MPVYRLDPIDADNAAWTYSREKDTVWTAAGSPKFAREQVAARSGFAALAIPGAISPWLDEKVTSCVEEPTQTFPDFGEVIREDGSQVDF